jgi:hypothetical protein
MSDKEYRFKMLQMKCEIIISMLGTANRGTMASYTDSPSPSPAETFAEEAWELSNKLLAELGREIDPMRELEDRLNEVQEDLKKSNEDYIAFMANMGIASWSDEELDAMIDKARKINLENEAFKEKMILAGVVKAEDFKR